MPLFTLVNRVPVCPDSWTEYYKVERDEYGPLNADDLNDYAYSLRDDFSGRAGRVCVSNAWVENFKPNTATIVLRCVRDV